MKNFLKILGMTESDIQKQDEKQQKIEEEQIAFQNQWKPWLNEHESTAIGYNTLIDMQNMRKNISEENILIVKPLKKNLNAIIQFSSSKHNEFKKSDYVRLCFDAIHDSTTDNPIDSVMETTTGCFSSGAHGHGSKKGGATFNAKFTTSGTYRLEIPFGQPYLILDNCKLVLFEGFDYDAKVVVNQDVLDKYREYKIGQHQDGIEF